MRKLITSLLLVAACMFSTEVWAQSQRLVVWQKSGQKVYYELADEPHTTFDNGMLVISSNRIRHEYKLSDILRYTYDGEFNDIETPVGDGMGYRQSGDDLDIFGLEKGSLVQLYNMGGILLDSQKADGTNILHFSLSNRPAGTYLVKIGDQTLKFMKR